MMKVNLEANVSELAIANDFYGVENIMLSRVVFPWMAASNYMLSSRSFYVVSHHYMDCDDDCWDMVFNDLRSAAAEFGKEVNRRGCPSNDRVYGRVEWTESWPYYRHELAPDFVKEVKE